MTTSVPRSTGGAPSHGLWSTSSRAATPASPSRPPDAAAAPKTHAGSGPSSHPLWTSCAPPTCSVRTSSGTERAAFVSCSLISTSSDTPPVPALSALLRWVRLISESGSSYLPSEETIYPTPTAAHVGTNQGGMSPRAGKVRPSLDTMAAQGLWPTPTARLGDPKRGMPSTEHAQARWDSGRRNLDDAVRLPEIFPTPMARDSQRGGATAETMARRALKTNTGPTLSDHLGGPLNPTFVEWLMGFPLGWTDLGP